MDLPFADGEIADARTGLELVRPNGAYLASYRDACEETWNHIHNRYILHDPSQFEQWGATIFSTFEDRFCGRSLPEGYYPSLMLWAVRDAGFIGAVNIRLKQDEELIRYGGTLGYFLRTSARGQGLGHSIAALGLEAARRMGVQPLVITCQESNAASMAVSERLPYLRKERAIEDVDGTVEPIWRYWFDDGETPLA